MVQVCLVMMSIGVIIIAEIIPEKTLSIAILNICVMVYIVREQVRLNNISKKNTLKIKQTSSIYLD